MNNNDYDAIVIGGGSPGEAVRAARDAGAVAWVDVEADSEIVTAQRVAGVAS